MRQVKENFSVVEKIFLPGCKISFGKFCNQLHFNEAGDMLAA